MPSDYPDYSGRFGKIAQTKAFVKIFRVREFLASKFSDRAEIELRYIRLLQDWLDDLDPPRDQNDATGSYYLFTVLPNAFTPTGHLKCICTS